MEILLPMTAISGAYEETIIRIFNIEKVKIQERINNSLTQYAVELERFFKINSIDLHPLTEIILEAISSIKEHVAVVDTLGESKMALLHVRHIQELATVVEWVVSLDDRYEEFKWRWKNFTHIHTIRNKILNLKEPIERHMQDWIDSEMVNIDRYVNIHVDKKLKLTADCVASQKAWVKYGNWLYPFGLNLIFDGVSKKQTYTSTEYDWNSHAVHFSPLANDFIEYDLKDFTYHEFSQMSIRFSLNIFLKKCWCILKSQDAAREMFTQENFLEAYKFSRSKPEWFSRMVQEDSAHKKITAFCLNKTGSLDDAILLVAGPKPIDPLAIIK
ncbi:MAG TPA: hypothetical protein PK002_05175 [Cellvibrio sp.]|nr:hypothetical protein [Cellvibrio sp.]